MRCRAKETVGMAEVAMDGAEVETDGAGERAGVEVAAKAGEEARSLDLA